MWIFNVTQYVSWQNEDSITVYRIGVYSANKDIYDEVQQQTLSRTIKSKPTEATYYKNFKNITDIDILFVCNDKILELQKILAYFHKKNILIISDQAANNDNSMINILPLTVGTKRFEVNENNMKENNFIATKELLYHGGDESSLKGLYAETEKELEVKRQLLEQQQKEINLQKEELQRQIEENKNQKNEILKQQELISQQGEKIDGQKQELETLMQDLEKQQDKLKENLALLQNQEKLITDKQREVEVREEEIKTKLEELNYLEEEIAHAKSTLDQANEKLVVKDEELNRKNFILIVGAIFVAVIIVFLYLFWHAYRVNLRMNRELTKKNEEINKQKNEIETQSEQLELSNRELEKLSIVASRTQNAVSIMDSNGNFEWVNLGFTRMYGYTYQLLLNELDENIKNVSSNPQINEIIENCLSTKKSVIYEVLNKTRNGENIWVQTTLTPILDENDEVIRLVAIDADITIQKLAEKQIREKNEELENQKEHIELQNKQIHASINYAQTIQRTILPIQEQIDKHFDSFIIFLPKDIVSGDFYWFAENNGYQFIAAVDCTGHGVPGAFMSLIASRILNEIINEKKIFLPNEILDNVNEGIKKALKQDISDNNDGMDICFCCIEKLDTNSYELAFCGAKRSLLYHIHDTKNIQILKADRKSIGGTRVKKNIIPFTNTKLKLNSKDTIYLTTDGYTDQNNPQRAKMGSEKLVNILENCANSDMTTQKLELESQLFIHMKDAEQRDDITVIGIRFV